MKKERFQLNSGFSLLEPLLAGALLSFVALGLVSGIVFSQKNIVATTEKTKALFLAEVGLEAARAIEESDFEALAEGAWGLTTQGGLWALAASPDVTEAWFTRRITITAPSGDTREVVSEVSYGEEESVSLEAIFTNWQEP